MSGSRGPRGDARAPAAQAVPRCRLRDLGVVIGRWQPGPHNAITDVRGVRVGHCTLQSGRGRLRVGQGPVRTGVTAILPNEGNVFMERLVGGAFVLNGAGEISGLTQVQEWGLIETPILLTSTLSVGTCSDACVQYLVNRYPGIGRFHDVIIPLVGECDDSWLNDAGGRHVRAEHVLAAIEAAQSGPVQEGTVGSGTGMCTLGVAGGIGTSSRRLPRREGGYTVGLLVMSNFGHLPDLRIAGVPLGQHLEPGFEKRRRRVGTYGSIIAVVATDAPLHTHQLNRLSKRVALGIGRAGSYAAHGSGEIVLAFSTANKLPRGVRRRVHEIRALSDEHIDPLYIAAVEATEEAILNAICMSNTITGHSGHVAWALPLDEVREVLSRYTDVAAPREGAAPAWKPRPTLGGPLAQAGVGPSQQGAASGSPAGHGTGGETGAAPPVAPGDTDHSSQLDLIAAIEEIEARAHRRRHREAEAEAPPKQGRGFARA